MKSRVDLEEIPVGFFIYRKSSEIHYKLNNVCRVFGCDARGEFGNDGFFVALLSCSII